jgi:hypothetical protein
MNLDVYLRKAVEIATLDSAPEDVASKQVVVSYVPSMALPKEPHHHRRPQAFSSCAVFRVIRYLIMMRVKPVARNAATLLTLRNSNDSFRGGGQAKP